MLAQRWNPSRLLLVAAAVLFAGLLAGACNGGSEDGLSGSVSIDGSSTVFPVTEAVAEEFQRIHRGVRVTVGVSGTGGGFQKFCSGETDISDASRPIREQEREHCAEEGVEFIELRVGLDGLAVVTSPDTGFLDFLTMEELHTIWAPEAEGTITRWSQVRESFPDEPIELFGPDTDSGTFDFFTEQVNGESGASRGDYTPSTDDNVLVVGVTGSEGSLAYFGYAYFTENRDRLRVVPIDAGAGPVPPSDETVAGGSYPLARPLYIYVRVDSLNAKPQVREFVRYYLSDEGIPLVSDVGYTPIAPAELESSREALESAITVDTDES